MLKFLTAVAIALMGATAAKAEPAYQFEPLPKQVEGVALNTPVAITNDGAVLFQECWTLGDQTAIYTEGRIETVVFEPGASHFPFWTATDINSSHEIVGNNWNFTGWYTG